jgi:hypothetical protein
MFHLNFVVSVGAYEKHATAHRVRQDGVNQVEDSAISPLYIVQKELQSQASKHASKREKYHDVSLRFIVKRKNHNKAKHANLSTYHNWMKWT